MAMADLILYVDLLSQPSRAVYIFCQENNIPHRLRVTSISRREHLSDDYKRINPLTKLPAIDDHGFKLAESHAILRYLVATRHCSDHWYPADAASRARVDMLLDWHHTSLRRGAAGLVMQEVLAPRLGRARNEGVAADALATLQDALGAISSIWLQPDPRGGSGPFLLGFQLPTIADLSMACEIEQLQLLGKERFEGLLKDAPRVWPWLERARAALQPHYGEAHAVLLRAAMGSQGRGPSASSAPDKGTTVRPGASPGRGMAPGAEMGLLYSPHSAAGRPARASFGAGKEDSPPGQAMGLLYSPAASDKAIGGPADGLSVRSKL